MALALLSSTALAAEQNTVTLRGSTRDGFTRLVLDGSAAPQYKMDNQGTKYTLHFSGPDQLTADAAALTKLPRLESYKITSPQTLEIDVAAGQQVNSFTVGNKVIFDIKGAAPKDAADSTAKEVTKVEPAASAAKTVPKPTPKTPPVTAAKDSKAPTQLIDTKKLPANIIVDQAGDKPATPKVEATTATTPAAPAADAPPVMPAKPIQISVSSTSEVPVTAFQRGGYLYIAEDRLEAAIPPTVSGMDGVTFAPVPADGFSMFRAKWASPTTLYPSGAGLVWKLSSDPTENKKLSPAVDVESKFGDASQTGPALFWGGKSIHRIADFKDPDTADMVKIVFVEDSADRPSNSHHYAEIDVLPSLIGLAFIPKTDDVTATKTPEGVMISRPNGLALSSQKDMMANQADVQGKQASPDVATNQQKIFDFNKWRIGDKAAISDNQRIIMSGLAEQTDVKRAESLIALGHMMLSFGYAPEAIGYFDLAEQTLPDLSSSPEFQAARAVAQELAGRSKEAFATLSTSQLNDVNEIKYWKAYALADLEDWQQAAATLPNDSSILETYPQEVRWPLGLQMAEIALRQGNPDKARTILDILGKDKDQMDIARKSALDYLNGEYFRQKGQLEESKKLWKDLTTGYDDLYRAKARFALSTLQYETKDITIDKAIDNLEGLRYAWRGDGLETSINYNLGKLYLQKGEPMKALTLIRLAASLGPDTEQGKKITADLHDTFQGLFTPDNIKKLTPIDAMTVYNEFADLVPTGPEGDKMQRQLADRLVDADLLPRAEGLLQKQVNGDLQGTEGADVAIRLASLQVLDGKGAAAKDTLDKADAFLAKAPPDEAGPRQRDIGILRAKALSLLGKAQDAFDVLAKLPQDDAVLKMRADIAWRNKKWQDAADALEQVLGQQDISLTRPLTDEQAGTILNWAVALYLADNRYVLANLRERYADAMSQTPLAKKFDVITRPRQMALLTDRDTIQSIVNETDIFKDFLTTFKPDPKKVTAPVPAGSDSVSGGGTGITGPIPADLKNSPLLKTDEFKGD